MKSQDILILLKLVSLEYQEKLLQDKKKSSDLYFQGWEGWDADEDTDIIKLGEEYKDSKYILSDKYTARGLASSLGVSKTEVSASIKRSVVVGMAIYDRMSGQPKANTKALLEFIVHGLKYVFPSKPAEIVRGIPTSFAAPVLAGEVMTAGDYIYVWPDARGKHKGQHVSPLYKSVPFAVKQDPLLYEYLALIDAIRLGSPREAKVAEVRLEERLRDK